MIDDGLPDGLAKPPLGFMAFHGEELPGRRIDEIVINYAMVRGVEARGDGVVVGECEGGEDGDEAGLRLGPIGNEAADVGRWGLELVSESEPIRGDE